MTVDWFLVDAPHVVPLEFQAWEKAKQRHYEIFIRCTKAPPGSAELESIETEAHAAKEEVDRLEKVARDLWTKKR